MIERRAALYTLKMRRGVRDKDKEQVKYLKLEKWRSVEMAAMYESEDWNRET